MLGVEVCDPDLVEGDIERLPGLGLLPITTTMSGEKTTRQVVFDKGMKGYEIHMGETKPFGDAPFSPLFKLNDGRHDGYIVDETCMGTYVHGVLDNKLFVDRLLKPFAGRLEEKAEQFDYEAFKNEQYDKLAAHVRKYVDIDRIYSILSSEV